MATRGKTKIEEIKLERDIKTEPDTDTEACPHTAWEIVEEVHIKTEECSDAEPRDTTRPEPQPASCYADVHDTPPGTTGEGRAHVSHPHPEPRQESVDTLGQYRDVATVCQLGSSDGKALLFLDTDLEKHEIPKEAGDVGMEAVQALSESPRSTGERKLKGVKLNLGKSKPFKEEGEGSSGCSTPEATNQLQGSQLKVKDIQGTCRIRIAGVCSSEKRVQAVTGEQYPPQKLASAALAGTKQNAAAVQGAVRKVNRRRERKRRGSAVSVDSTEKAKLLVVVSADGTHTSRVWLKNSQSSAPSAAKTTRSSARRAVKTTPAVSGVEPKPSEPVQMTSATTTPAVTEERMPAILSSTVVYPHCNCHLDDVAVQEREKGLEHVGVIWFMQKKLFTFRRGTNLYTFLMEYHLQNLLPQLDIVSSTLDKVKQVFKSNTEIVQAVSQEWEFIQKVYPKWYTTLDPFTLVTPYIMHLMYREFAKDNDRWTPESHSMFYLSQYAHTCPWTSLVLPWTGKEKLPTLQNFSQNRVTGNTHVPRILAGRKKNPVQAEWERSHGNTSVVQLLRMLIKKFALQELAEPFCFCEMTISDLADTSKGHSFQGACHYQVGQVSFMDGKSVYCWLRPNGIFVSVQELKAQRLLPRRQHLTQRMLYDCKEEDRPRLTDIESDLVMPFASAIPGEVCTSLINIKTLRMMYRVLSRASKVWAPFETVKFFIKLRNHECNQAKINPALRHTHQPSISGETGVKQEVTSLSDTLTSPAESAHLPGPNEVTNVHPKLNTNKLAISVGNQAQEIQEPGSTSEKKSPVVQGMGSSPGLRSEPRDAKAPIEKFVTVCAKGPNQESKPPKTPEGASKRITLVAQGMRSGPGFNKNRSTAQVPKEKVEAACSESLKEGIKPPDADSQFPAQNFPKACSCTQEAEVCPSFSIQACVPTTRDLEVLVVNKQIGQAAVRTSSDYTVLLTFTRDTTLFFSIGELQMKGILPRDYDLDALPGQGRIFQCPVADEMEVKSLRMREVNLKTSIYSDRLMSAELLCHLLRLMGRSLQQDDIYLMKLSHVCHDVTSVAHVIHGLNPQSPSVTAAWASERAHTLKSGPCLWQTKMPGHVHENAQGQVTNPCAKKLSKKFQVVPQHSGDAEPETEVNSTSSTSTEHMCEQETNAGTASQACGSKSANIPHRENKPDGNREIALRVMNPCRCYNDVNSDYYMNEKNSDATLVDLIQKVEKREQDETEPKTVSTVCPHCCPDSGMRDKDSAVTPTMYEGKVVRRWKQDVSPDSDVTLHPQYVRLELIKKSLGSLIDDFWIVMTGVLDFSGVSLACIYVDDKLFVNWTEVVNSSTFSVELIYQLACTLQVQVYDPLPALRQHLLRTQRTQCYHSVWLSTSALRAVYFLAVESKESQHYPSTLKFLHSLFVEKKPEGNFTDFILMRKTGSS